MQQLHLVGYARNGVGVYVDLVSSKAAKHIAREPHLLRLAADALPGISLKKPAVHLEHDMGRLIGYDFVIKATDADSIFYVQLVRDTAYTRFTKSGKPSPTQYLSLIMQRGADGISYELHDIWIGRQTPPKPGSDDETDESKAYWGEHALIFDNQPMQSRTLTKTRPY